MGMKAINDTIDHSQNYGGGYFLGTVVANTDSLHLGRVQAKVPGLYETDQGAVPWIGNIKDSPFGFGKGPKGPYGVYGSPYMGSTVKVELQHGDEHMPLCTSILTAPNVHPWFNTPNRWGYVDPSGNSLQVDMDANTWVWTHESGDTISYDGSGNVVKVVKGNDTENITGNASSTIGGNLTFQVSGNANINCSSFNLDASGAATYKAASHSFVGPINANATVTAQGDITDNAGTNASTMANMRSVFNEHQHHYFNDSGQQLTDVPIPQV